MSDTKPFQVTPEFRERVRERYSHYVQVSGAPKNTNEHVSMLALAMVEASDHQIHYLEACRELEHIFWCRQQLV